MPRLPALLIWLLLLWGLCWPGHVRAATAFKPTPAGFQPEDLVAQLLLITWDGALPQEENAPFWAFLRKYAIGGVLIQPPRGLALSRETVTRFVTQAQTLSYQARRERYGLAGRDIFPLFIAVRQYGDGPPLDALAFPYTLPPPMALAATWNPDNARLVGRLLGRELRAWGVNLLLGPTLDPVDPTHLGQPGDLGLRTFGEHPYWVTRMAAAYIQGLHEATQGRLAVIGETFPGYGGAVRPMEEEIPTLPMSLEALENTRLHPFLELASANKEGSPEGFLVGHIRAQALQGNIKAETPPLSLDPNTPQFLRKNFPQLRNWYEQPFHLWVIADLGAASLKRYYQALDMPYRPEQVAEQALRAGGDLLILGPGFTTKDQDYLSTVETVVQALAQKYRNDPLFARRVDEAFARVQQLKFRLFPHRELAAILPDLETPGMETAPDLENALLALAQQSATLLAPQAGEDLGPPPSSQEHILILVDEGERPACSGCEDLPPPFPAPTFMNLLLKIYGPQGAGRLLPSQVRVLGQAQVQLWLEGADPERVSRIQYLMNWATWVVFLVSHPASPGTQILLQALEQSPELWRARRVEVFALGPPYVLSASHLPQVNAYYGLYSKSQSALNMAARLLFREASPQGASPVSIPALGYSIPNVLAPDAAQTIPLAWVIPGQGTTTEPKVKKLRLNDAVTVEAGPILDHNGHPVPDNTPLSFLLTGLGGKPLIQRVEGFTRDGVGRASFIFDREGVFEIRVESGEARKSHVLQVEVALAPTPTPTATAVPPSPSPTRPQPTPVSHKGPSEPGRETLFLFLLGLWSTTSLTVGLVARYAGRRPWLWGLLAFNLDVWGGLGMTLFHGAPAPQPLFWENLAVAGILLALLWKRPRAGSRQGG